MYAAAGLKTVIRSHAQRAIWLIVTEEVHLQRGLIDPEHCDVKSVGVQLTHRIVVQDGI